MFKQSHFWRTDGLFRKLEGNTFMFISCCGEASLRGLILKGLCWKYCLKVVLRSLSKVRLGFRENRLRDSGPIRILNKRWKVFRAICCVNNFDTYPFGVLELCPFKRNTQSHNSRFSFWYIPSRNGECFAPPSSDDSQKCSKLVFEQILNMSLPVWAPRFRPLVVCSIFLKVLQSCELRIFHVLFNFCSGFHFLCYVVPSPSTSSKEIQMATIGGCFAPPSSDDKVFLQLVTDDSESSKKWIKSIWERTTYAKFEGRRILWRVLGTIGLEWVKIDQNRSKFRRRKSCVIYEVSYM